METSRYDLVNKNGAPICHGVACRKRTTLVVRYGGIFCKKCLEKISTIRNKLLYAKMQKNVPLEVEARQEEALFRKIMEPGHMFYLFELEKAVEHKEESQ